VNKHFIFTSGRSGSNYLSNTLNISKKCVNYGEVLGEWTVPYKLIYTAFFKNKEISDYLGFIYSNNIFFYLGQVYSCFSHFRNGRRMNFKFKREIESIGIKDFFITMGRREGAFQYISNHPEIKVIYLYRSNILNRYISLVFMGENNRAVSYKKIKNKKLHINIEDLLEKMDTFSLLRKEEQEFIASLKNHEVLNVEYEEYFEDSNSINFWNKKIFEFIGLDDTAELSQQKKILSNTLKDNILNYDELVSSLKGTEYEQFLN